MPLPDTDFYIANFLMVLASPRADREGRQSPCKHGFDMTASVYTIGLSTTILEPIIGMRGRSCGRATTLIHQIILQPATHIVIYRYPVEQ